jgi:hypothetical protein
MISIFGFKFLMTLFKYALDNSLFFGIAFAGTVGFIGYKFASSYLNSVYINKGIQTEAWENYSNRSSQMAPESITSIDTITPISENISPVTTLQTTSEIGTETITDGTSTVTTVLPTPPINIEIVPNPDLVGYTLTHKSLIESKIQEINGLYGKEMFDYTITNADLTYIVNCYSITQLNSSGINETILNLMSCFNG